MFACLSDKFMCDGIKHCLSGEDELDCGEPAFVFSCIWFFFTAACNYYKLCLKACYKIQICTEMYIYVNAFPAPLT